MPVKRKRIAKSKSTPKPASQITPAAEPKPREFAKSDPAIDTSDAEIPYWVDSTHPEHMYRLVLFESGDAGVEEVDLTRTEYIALKAHLAAMRGYRIGDLSAIVADLAKHLPEDYRSFDTQQPPKHLQDAREIHRYCPDLVVFESSDLDERLAALAE